jgi:hypothetical protein
MAMISNICIVASHPRPHTLNEKKNFRTEIKNSKQIASFTTSTGPEYGTTEAAWKGILTEAERVSDLHMNMKDKLCNDVMQEIRVWQKENYHKVTKNTPDGFINSN